MMLCSQFPLLFHDQSTELLTANECLSLKEKYEMSDEWGWSIIYDGRWEITELSDNDSVSFCVMPTDQPT